MRSEPPDGLTAHAVAAWHRAWQTARDPERSRDGVDRYALAVDACDRIRAAWESAGCPVIVPGGATGRSDVAHPILRAMREHEAHAHAIGRDLGLLPDKAPDAPIVVDRLADLVARRDERRQHLDPAGAGEVGPWPTAA